MPSVTVKAICTTSFKVEDSNRMKTADGSEKWYTNKVWNNHSGIPLEYALPNLQAWLNNNHTPCKGCMVDEQWDGQ